MVAGSLWTAPLVTSLRAPAYGQTGSPPPRICDCGVGGAPFRRSQTLADGTQRFLYFPFIIFVPGPGCEQMCTGEDTTYVWTLSGAAPGVILTGANSSSATVDVPPGVCADHTITLNQTDRCTDGTVWCIDETSTFDDPSC